MSNKTVEEHLKRMEEYFPSSIEDSIKRTRVLKGYPGILTPRMRYPYVDVKAESSVDAIYFENTTMEHKVAVLDFANATVPGGGYYPIGGGAQEGSLCAAGNLYNVISKTNEFYDINKGLDYDKEPVTMSCPDIYFIKDINGHETAFKADVIVSAAPRVPMMNEEDRKKLPDILRKKIRAILYTAGILKCDTLILGAYGCGVFGNDPDMVAKIFKDELRFLDEKCKNVIFAIYTKDPENDINYKAFSEVFDNDF